MDAGGADLPAELRLGRHRVRRVAPQHQRLQIGFERLVVQGAQQDVADRTDIGRYPAADLGVERKQPPSRHTPDEHHVRPVEHADRHRLGDFSGELLHDRLNGGPERQSGQIAIAQRQDAGREAEPLAIGCQVTEVLERQEHAPGAGTIKPRPGGDLGDGEGGVATIKGLENVEPLGQGQNIGVLAGRRGALFASV